MGGNRYNYLFHPFFILPIHWHIGLTIILFSIYETPHYSFTVHHIYGRSYGRTADDVARYSYLQQGGSARYLGAGGAFGALGAEFGTVSSNPAGLALFRTDELVLTPSIRFSNVDAELTQKRQ